MRSATLTGLGTHRTALVDNHAIAERIGSSDEWIQSRSGIVTRGLATDDETVVSMAAAAGQQALDRSGVAPSDIGLVLVATCTMYSTTAPLRSAAERVSQLLGLTSAGAADLGAACAGFTYGLSLAANAVRSGAAEHVLLIGSEKFSDIVDPDDRSTAFLFGDGAGAAVISAADVDGISAPAWLSDGSQADVLQTVGSPPRLHMDGQAVFRWATTTLPALARAACEKAAVRLSDLAAVVPHQANLRITQALVRALGLPPDVVVARDIVRSGNTSAASIPLAFSRLLDDREISTGDLVLLLGFGAGLTASGLVVRCP